MFKCETCGGCGKDYDVNGHNGNHEFNNDPCETCGGAGAVLWLTRKPQAHEMKWHLRFLAMAQLISTWSKDPSTKTGAVLVRPDRTVAGLGYNGFAKDMRDTEALYGNREIKYSRVIHCEMNALLFSRDPLPLTGHTLYTTGPSCDRCAAHMIQAGIRKFVFAAPTPEQFSRWNVERTLDFFREVKAEVVVV